MTFLKKFEYLGLFLLLVFSQKYGRAQVGDLRLLDWQPKSQLIVPETRIIKPRFPVIDFHNHLGHLENAKKYLTEMEKAGVWQCVSLDGRSAKDFYKKHLQESQAVSKYRFIVFFRPDWSKIDEPDFGRKEAQKLEDAVKRGARGMKVAKDLGLMVKDKSGKLVPVDDPRIDPLWAKCGELGIPVVIHVSDPVAFWDPVDSTNERYEKLALHPDYRFSGSQYPSKEEILAQRNRVMAKFPNTIFVGAHVGNLATDLGRVAMWFNQYPNFYVDISARIAELGRQPYTARKFMIEYQDRIVFGTDSYPDAETYRLYYRFLETSDEYIDRNAGKSTHHERWMIYGIHLPDSVLEKIYNKNALKILSMYKGNPTNYNP
jgi:predicted TIM-barrel fold metal-dependent hydrolase